MINIVIESCESIKFLKLLNFTLSMFFFLLSIELDWAI